MLEVESRRPVDRHVFSHSTRGAVGIAQVFKSRARAETCRRIDVSAIVIQLDTSLLYRFYLFFACLFFHQGILCIAYR